MKINGYTLVNAEKVNRAIHGMIGPDGQLFGGVGEDASEDAIIAEYDRLGGLIRKGKSTVKTGSFYDFAKKQVRKEPEVVFVFRDLDGDVVELAEGEEKPIELVAAEKIQEKRQKKLEEKEAAKEEKKAASKNKKKSIEDEEDSE